MPGRQGRDGRKADIPDTVIRIASGNTLGDPELAVRRTRHTVWLLSALPAIDYADWHVEIEVHVPYDLVDLYKQEMGKLPAKVFGRPEFTTRGAMRKYLEELGNPGYIVMCDDDFRGLDRFPSTNGNDIVQSPDAIAGLLRTAFADMAEPAALGKCYGFDFSEVAPPWVWGFRVRECEDISGKQGTSGPRVCLPCIKRYQPLLQNFVAIRAGAPGGYPEDMDYCEDAWRQESCRKIVGDLAVGTHLIAKIDFFRNGSNAKNKNNKAYQGDWKKFIAEFPDQRIIRMRSSWTPEQRKKYEPVI
jgi:hypothetical protein